MGADFQEFRRRERRLVALRCIAEGNGSANDSMLQRMLQLWGLPLSREQTRELIGWLDKRDLVRVAEIDDGRVLRADITTAGRDIATGVATHPDIAPRSSLTD